jgi:ribosomal protein S12 methylthiotransferase
VRLALITLGCPKNLVDAEVMLGLLTAEGHQLVWSEESADVAIVNTCSFIAAAIQESREFTENLLEKKAAGRLGRVIVAGCLPQRFGKATWEMFPGVDGVVGCSDFERIAEAVAAVAEGEKVHMVSEPTSLYDHASPRVLSAPSHTAYVKIAEGCDNRCAYCTIPGIRGRQRSRSPESVVTEARDLVEAGVRELSLIAQDTTAYGTDIALDVTLAGLLGRLSDVGAPWIRVLYTHPAHITEELLHVMAETPAVVPYIDVPIQHISDRILTAMGRRTTGDAIRGLLDRVRELIPDVSIRSSVMGGFPGETAAEFEELSSFVGSGRIDHLGVFEYSPEPGTRAAALPDQVGNKVATERAFELSRKMLELAAARGRRLQGRVVTALLEETGQASSRGRATARTAGQAYEMDPVTFVEGVPDEARPGDFIEVRITGPSGLDLEATTELEP